MDRRTTLRDVAELANVSISTASRVINGQALKSASKPVQERIWQAVKALNYAPNKAAQSLRTGLSDNKPMKAIACIYTRTDSSHSDPFFLEITEALESELLKYGFHLKFSISSMGISKETLATFLNENSIEGVIILGRFDEQTLQLVRKFQKYIIYVGLNRLPYDIDQVICDGYYAAMIALKHLKNTGKNEIYYLGECEKESRYSAFRHFMSGYYPIDRINQFVIETPFNSEAGNRKLRKILDKGIIPEAIFCGNDNVALGALKALRDYQIDVPGQTAVIGIDDIEMAQFSSPMLTTVAVPKEHLGKKAARFMADRIANGNDIHVIIQIPVKLIIRETA